MHESLNDGTDGCNHYTDLVNFRITFKNSLSLVNIQEASRKPESPEICRESSGTYDSWLSKSEYPKTS